MPAAETTSLLRLPQVLARVGVSRATLYTRIKEGAFPRPVALGPRSVAWPSDEVESWIRSRVAASRASAAA